MPLKRSKSSSKSSSKSNPSSSSTNDSGSAHVSRRKRQRKLENIPILSGVPNLPEGPINELSDDVLLRVFSSPNLRLRDRLNLRQVNKRFKEIIDTRYFNVATNLQNLSYKDLNGLASYTYTVARNPQINRLIREILAQAQTIAAEFMPEGVVNQDDVNANGSEPIIGILHTNRVSELKRRLKDGTITLAAAQLILDRLLRYSAECDEAGDPIMPNNQQGFTLRVQRRHNDFMKKYSMLDDFIKQNKMPGSNVATSSSGKYREMSPSLS